jgi:hypothetical protein
MAIKSINFIIEGSEPKQTRNTASNKDIEQVMVAAKTFPLGKAMVIDTDPEKKFQAYGLCRKLKKAVDEKKFEVYRCKSQVIIRRTVVINQAKAK